ncbi:MAG TPA: hypothetical protein VFB14_29065 [Bryobacteraceae bacterium]|jgi:DNA-binding PadR family transcriptional regulator|nr:hypothetical protein [Bryobacteraceae bacterium]
MAPNSPELEWKKGSAELLVLSLLEDQPRHRYDSLTPEGRKALRSQRKSWQEFFAAMSLVTGVEHA